MDVDLPATGCNVINSSTTFYNYSPDSRTRQTWVIYEGKAYLQSESYSQYGYTYTGTCLHTGDMVYNPEFQPYAQFMSIILCSLIAVLLWKTLGRILGR